MYPYLLRPSLLQWGSQWTVWSLLLGGGVPLLSFRDPHKWTVAWQSLCSAHINVSDGLIYEAGFFSLFCSLVIEKSSQGYFVSWERDRWSRHRSLEVWATRACSFSMPSESAHTQSQMYHFGLLLCPVSSWLSGCEKNSIKGAWLNRPWLWASGTWSCWGTLGQHCSTCFRNFPPEKWGGLGANLPVSHLSLWRAVSRDIHFLVLHLAIHLAPAYHHRQKNHPQAAGTFDWLRWVLRVMGGHQKDLL
jgi:hypothetical protein